MAGSAAGTRGKTLLWFAIVIVGLALCAPWGNIPRDQADSAGMLAHLHAYFVDGDLLYDNEYARLNMSPLFAFVTGEGVVSNHWPAGATWLQLPGYALGLSAGHVLAMLGVGDASTLGVIPVLGLRAWACLVLGGVLAVIGRQAARATQGSPRQKLAVGTAVAMVFALGTPLLYYTVEAPLRPHLWGAASVLALVRVWMRTDIAADRPWARTLLLALLAGLAATVRPQLAPLALLVVHDAWSGEGRARRLLVAVAGLALWPALHLRTQLWIYGADLSDYAGEVTLHLEYFLVSPHHGLLLWCPVAIVAAAAVARAARRNERGAIVIALLLAHQIWLDSGMRPIDVESVLGTRTWAGGTGFAARKLVDVVPLLLPATLSLVRAGSTAKWGKPLLAGTLLLSLPTALLHAAAFLSPDRTTGALIGSMSALGELMQLPLRHQAWSAALQARAVPLSVPLVISAVVTLPLAVVGYRLGSGLRLATRSARVNLGLAALLGGGAVAHLWLSAMQVRSDAALVAAPQRMVAAKRQLNPRHRATVGRIEGHHARMRAVLGQGAAP
ncbi:MAG: hypothetical protein JKY37_02590 [Nannocystaceae bacterium]|nr:hypothetical protein [Nannocystaceae bacterium]